MLRYPFLLLKGGFFFGTEVYKLGQPSWPASCVRNALFSPSWNLEMQDLFRQWLEVLSVFRKETGHNSASCAGGDCCSHGSWGCKCSRFSWTGPGPDLLAWLGWVDTAFPFLSVDIAFPFLLFLSPWVWQSERQSKSWLSQVHVDNRGFSRAICSQRAFWMVPEIRNERDGPPALNIFCLGLRFFQILSGNKEC